jgi:hypothetical protein
MHKEPPGFRPITTAACAILGFTLLIAGEMNIAIPLIIAAVLIYATRVLDYPRGKPFDYKTVRAERLAQDHARAIAANHARYAAAQKADPEGTRYAPPKTPVPPPLPPLP